MTQPLTNPANAAGQIWAQSARPFGIDLFKACAEATPNDKNVLVSPHVLGEVLGMVAAGAKGRTAEQMGTLLHDPQGNNVKGISTYEAALSDPSAPYQIQTAKGVYVQRSFPVEADYIARLKNHFGVTEVKDSDFASNSEGERVRINKDVATATRDMVTELFPEGTIDGDTVLVLTAALFANFGWSIKFDKDLTTLGAFQLAGGVTQPAALMHRISETPYFEDETVQVLELGFAGGRFSAMIVLPKDSSDNPETSLAGIEKNLSVEKYLSWLDGLSAHKSRGLDSVDITLPRLDLKDGKVLNKILRKLGVTDAFGPQADLTGISSATLPGELFLQAVVDGNALKLDENGATVAAAAGASVGLESCVMPVKFTADRPFLLIIRDTMTGVPLLMARVANPGNADLTIKKAEAAVADYSQADAKLLEVLNSSEFQWKEGVDKKAPNYRSRQVLESLNDATIESFAEDFERYLRKGAISWNPMNEINQRTGKRERFNEAALSILMDALFTLLFWKHTFNNSWDWPALIEPAEEMQQNDSPAMRILGKYLENLLLRLQAAESNQGLSDGPVVLE